MKSDRRFFKELRFRQLRALVELSRQKTFSAVAAALKAGADGLILSRKYSEMRLANLNASGKAVREFSR